MDFKLKTIESVFEVNRIANVHFFEFPKGYETNKAKHPFCELIFVNTGHLQIRSEDYTGKLHKNEMIIHPANSYHALTCPADKETSVIILGFECISKKSLAFLRTPVLLTETEVKQLAEIVKEGRNVFAPPYNVPLFDMEKKKNQPFGSEQMLRGLIETFLIGLVRKYEVAENKDEQENSRFQIQEIIGYANANFTEKVTLDELAFLFRTNRSTLCKEFKNATGKTLVEFVQEKKLQKAKRMLVRSGKTVSEISDELGFESSAYFCRFFKRKTGLTPKDFQKQNR